VSDPARLGQRLAALRRARDEATGPLDLAAGSSTFLAADPGIARVGSRRDLIRRTEDLARRLADAVGGEWIRGTVGGYVRVEQPSIVLPLDRARLSRLPDFCPEGAPLVCLDTETTGLATGPGTVAFLVGVGTWVGDRFEQVQLLLPDHAEEPALLDALADAIPADAWLVTYNGRGFDWPLLVARYRMSRRPPPVHAGHLDLLPFVRRIFRHRLTDARLRTVEAELLGVERGRDVEGWEIPGRYLDFLRGGPAAPLAEVVRHNHEDVRSLARLLAHAVARFGDPGERRFAPVGDLAGLGRAYRRLGQTEDALACFDLALEARVRPARLVRSWTAILTTRADEPGPAATPGRDDRDTLLVDRARLLRRLGRHDEALEAWLDLGRGGGRWAGVGWIEVAKILEHRRRDPAAALEACGRATRIVERARLIGQRLPLLETDLARRRRRLDRRVAAARPPNPSRGRLPATLPARPARVAEVAGSIGA